MRTLHAREHRVLLATAPLLLHAGAEATGRPAQVAANRVKLPIALARLPGGGLGQGVTAHVEDQVQEFQVQIEITHKVQLLHASLPV